MLFTFLLGGGFNAFNVDETVDNRIPLLVVNEDQSQLANTLLAALAESDSVRIDVMTGPDAEAAFADETAPALLLIPAGFETALLASETAVLDLRQLPDNNDANVAARALNTAVSQISRTLAAARSSVLAAAEQQPFASDASRNAYFATSLVQAQTLAADIPQRVLVTQPASATIEAATYDPAAQSSVGQLITWVFIPLLGTSGFLALERTRGTLRRLLTTPTQKATYLLGTIIGQ